jgi:hypothetical protein
MYMIVYVSCDVVNDYMPRPAINRTGERLAISAALNDHMEKSGCGQGNLAALIGIPRLSLINYLECRQTPRPRVLGKLKAFFGPNFPYLAAKIPTPGLGVPPPAPDVPQRFALGGEILLETHDPLVSARLTRKRPNSLELIIEFRRTGSD